MVLLLSISFSMVVIWSLDLLHDIIVILYVFFSNNHFSIIIFLLISKENRHDCHWLSLVAIYISLSGKKKNIEKFQIHYQDMSFIVCYFHFEIYSHGQK